MVYYRKYRPQTISELDSVSVRETLQAVLSKKETPHAFLFTGPKGLGKTSTARIIAKVVNCEHTVDLPEQREGSQKGSEKILKQVQNDKSFEPDNTCDQCVSITNGTNIDVLEIDGASNRGIDEIRDLRERVRLAPSQAKKKVYIIDEVHMLTTEAFNALLKTIEEPPSHVMFMFCTTEPHKVPATILSRCFHIAFMPATEEEIVHSLQRIVTGEKLSVEPAALVSLAQMADGGFRDGAKLLEEAVTLSGGQKITTQIIEEKFHIKGITQDVDNLLSALAVKNVREGMRIISTAVMQGNDIKFFTAAVIDTLHSLLLEKVGTSEKKHTISEKFSLEEIETLVFLATDCAQQLKYSLIPQLPLELFVIAWCGQKSGSIISPVVSSGKQTIETLLRKERNLKVHNLLHPKEKEEKNLKVTAQQPDITTHTNGNETLMENIIYKVKPINASVAGVLRGCSILEVTDGILVFEAAYKFHKERLEEAKTYAIIEKAVREVTGKPLKITVRLKK